MINKRNKCHPYRDPAEQEPLPEKPKSKAERLLEYLAEAEPWKAYGNHGGYRWKKFEIWDCSDELRLEHENHTLMKEPKKRGGPLDTLYNTISIKANDEALAGALAAVKPRPPAATPSMPRYSRREWGLIVSLVFMTIALILALI